VFLDKLLNVNQVSGDMPDRLVQGGVSKGESNLSGHLGDVVAAVAAVNHLVNFKHGNHILRQEVCAFLNLCDLL
jgi:hypothetical protein